MDMDRIDFLPERIRAQRRRRRRLLRQGNLLALCVAAACGLMYFGEIRVRRAEADLAMLAGRRDEVRRQLEQRDGYERRLGDLMVKQRIESTLGSRVSALAVLAELEAVLPDSVVLVDLNIETMSLDVPVEPLRSGRVASRVTAAPGRPAQKSRKVKRLRVVVTGIARSDVAVASFIGRLAGSRCFENVAMGYTRNVTFRGRVSREFQASCYVAR